MKCWTCQAPLPPRKPGPGRRQRYCSPRCRPRPRRAAQVRRGTVHRCGVCAAQFCRLREAAGPQPRYCSDACRNRRPPATRRRKNAYKAEKYNIDATQRWHRARGQVIECRYCGSLFCELRRASGRRRTFCSRACLDNWYSPPALPATYLCSKCGDPIRGTTKYPRAYCSAQCKRALRNDRRLNRELLLALLARDGNECWICGEPIDHGVCAPDRMAATSDHVVPLSNPLWRDKSLDPHAETNLRAAHLGCNASRGNRVTLEEQLASGRPGGMVA
jgi:hypothetical protein